MVTKQGPEQRRLIRLASAINRKASRLGARGQITAADLGYIETHKRTCAYCGVRLEIGQGSFDHMLAFDRGGANAFHNLARCCLSCQRSKFTMTPEEFLAFKDLTVRCRVCMREFHPRHGEWKRGKATTCSHRCAAKLRWIG